MVVCLFVNQHVEREATPDAALLEHEISHAIEPCCEHRVGVAGKLGGCHVHEVNRIPGHPVTIEELEPMIRVFRIFWLDQVPIDQVVHLCHERGRRRFRRAGKVLEKK